MPLPAVITPLWWLLGEVVLSVAILALLPVLGRALGNAIEVHTRPVASVTRSQTRLIGQLLVLGIVLITVQAMLRRPLALIVNGDGRAALTFESAIAAIALTLVLALGVWLFQTGRPVVQALTLRAIDAAIPTIGTAAANEPTLTTIDDQATVLAPRRPSDPGPTIVADPDATIADAAHAATTLLDAAAPDATLRVSRPSP